MTSEFEQDLEIDKLALDTECLDQARRFHKWSVDYADATAERDRADQRLEVTKAQVEQDIRKDPTSYGLEKATDASVKSAVMISPKVKQAHEEWVEAKHKVGIMMAARDALEQRRAMLENLIKLFLSGYWSDPKVPTDAKENFAGQDMKKHDEKISKSLLKRKLK